MWYGKSSKNFIGDEVLVLEGKSLQGVPACCRAQRKVHTMWKSLMFIHTFCMGNPLKGKTSKRFMPRFIPVGIGKASKKGSYNV